LYVIDEPNDAAAYDTVRAWAQLVREADPKIRFLVTEQPWASNPDWGTLQGAVDVWVPLFQYMGDPRIADAITSGGTVWSYTALVQGDTKLPHWQIDFPLGNYRAAPLLTGRSGGQGMLYWSTVHWKDSPDPWVNPETYGETSGSERLHYNGEGSLLYPGKAIGYEGPVASLRLKALRDGIEDYEYIALLRKGGKSAQADAAVNLVARSWTDFSLSQSDYDSARALAAAALEAP
jgi:hypothetical protein